MVSQTIVFPKGLIGFEEVQELDLIWDQRRAPFHMLEAKEGISFILMPICEFIPDFQLGPTKEEAQLLSLEEADELVLFSIVTIPSDPSQMSANLQGPIIVNLSKRLGLQAIRPEEELRYPLLEGYKKNLLKQECQKC
jgi:flagellar assembly factor FliW